jgi:hypothetical protein
MSELEIKQKLDTLSEYQAQRDLMEADKRKLLDEVKLPEEVQAIVSAGMQRMAESEASFRPLFDEYLKEQNAKLAEIVIPEEIKAALEEIDRKRAQVTKAREDQDAELRGRIQAVRANIQAEINAQTHGIYTALAQRKAEIEAEFAGKAKAADNNINKLIEEIKAEVATYGLTVKGSFLMATYGEGRKTWIPKRLDKYTETHPDIQECYTVGDPVVTIRKI